MENLYMVVAEFNGADKLLKEKKTLIALRNFLDAVTLTKSPIALATLAEIENIAEYQNFTVESVPFLEGF